MLSSSGILASSVTLARHNASAALLAGWMLCLFMQSTYSQSQLNTESGDPIFPLEETWWGGSYSCAQGQTGLRLKTRAALDAAVEALFEFGPIYGNDTVPKGSFLMEGSIRKRDRFLQLNPTRWISQPPGYVMVGLAGTISGNAYHGSIVSGYRCGDFLVTRETKKISTLLSVPASRARAEQVPLQPEGGALTVPVLINNKLTLNFVVDSGAADVNIPADVVLTLVRTGTLNSSDFLGTQTYRLADGSTVPSQTFRIRSLKVGNKLLENVTGSIAPVDGSLLLGQSFLSRFRSWSIDNRRLVLILDAASGSELSTSGK